MHNVVPSAIEKIVSFSPGSCHGCRELHEKLKAALMQYLLATTNVYVHGEDVGRHGMQNVESNLMHAMKEFESHRNDTHFLDYFTPSWMEMLVRNAS